MKLNYKALGILALSVSFICSCQKLIIQEPPSKDNSMTNFSFFYQYPDTTWSNYSDNDWTSHGLKQITSISMNTISLTDLNYPVTISNDTVYVTPVIPSSGIPQGQLHNISLSKIWATASIPATSTIKPLNGAPVLGTIGDYSKPVTYQVTAADGSTKDWVIVATPLPVLNKYDGYYTLTGTMTDPSFPGLYPENISLVTYPTNSPNSVALCDPTNSMNYNNGCYHFIAAGTFFGEVAPVFTFDANDNVISVTNMFGDPSPGRQRSLELDPSGVNKWDPATKTLRVKYRMLQPGFSPYRTLFDETYTWVGTR